MFSGYGPFSTFFVVDFFQLFPALLLGATNNCFVDLALSLTILSQEAKKTHFYLQAEAAARECTD
jgi:hypothetical protein